MKTVSVVVFGGSVEDKVLVEDLGEVVLVTTEEEWEQAHRENRVPISVGFRREYIRLRSG